MWSAAALLILIALVSDLGAQSYQLRAQPAQSIYVDEHYRLAYFLYTVSNLYYDRADTLYSQPFTSRVYLSKDKVFDAGDRLLFEHRDRILSTVYVDREMDLPADIPPGEYYAIAVVDADNEIAEADETDNVSVNYLRVTGSVELPVRNNADTPDNPRWRWYTTTRFGIVNLDTSRWATGQSPDPAAAGARSQPNAYHVTQLSGPIENEYEHLETPWLNMRGRSGDVACFWYRGNFRENYYGLTFAVAHADKGIVFGDVVNPGPRAESFTVPKQRFGDWDCFCTDLSLLDDRRYSKARWTITHDSDVRPGRGAVAVDDIYFGPRLPDLALVDIGERLLRTDLAVDSISYTVVNGGGARSSRGLRTRLYFSTDETLDGGDILLAEDEIGTLAPIAFERRRVAIELSRLPAGASGGYVIVKVDADGAEVEIWEHNNTYAHPLRLTAYAKTPYAVNFETAPTGWKATDAASGEGWRSGLVPSGLGVARRAMRGAGAYYAQLAQARSANQVAYLTMPPLDVRQLARPVLSFDYIVDHGQTQSSREGGDLAVEYSVDGGTTFVPLPADQSQSVNFSSYENLDQIPNGPHAGLLAWNSPRELGSVEPVRAVVALPSAVRNAASVTLRFAFVGLPGETVTAVVLDEVEVAEGYTDLDLETPRALPPANAAGEVLFNLRYRNSGNYGTGATDVMYYLSRDTVISADDASFGPFRIAGIPPRSRFERILRVTGPAAFAGKDAYLMYRFNGAGPRLDGRPESGGAVPLKRVVPPYFEDFSEVWPAHWLAYAKNDDSYIYGAPDYVFQTRVPHGQSIGPDYRDTSHYRGVLHVKYVEKFNSPTSADLRYYVSPTFDFSGVSGARLSFKLFAYSREKGTSGASLEYSLDEGATWALLTAGPEDGAVNWYDQYVWELGSAGWTQELREADNRSNPNQAGMLGRSIDVSRFAGRPSVAFRFKYANRTDGVYRQRGLLIDDFRVDAIASDLVAEDALKGRALPLAPGAPSFAFPYAVANPSGEDAAATVTHFYHSADTLLDARDQYLGSAPAGVIRAGATLRDTVRLTGLRGPFRTRRVYVLTVADGGADLGEREESNNVAASAVALAEGANWIGQVESVMVERGAGARASLFFLSEGPSDAPATQVRVSLFSDTTGVLGHARAQAPGSASKVMRDSLLQITNLRSSVPGQYERVNVGLAGVDLLRWPYLVAAVEPGGGAEYRRTDDYAVLALMPDTTGTSSVTSGLGDEAGGSFWVRAGDIVFCGSGTGALQPSGISVYDAGGRLVMATGVTAQERDCSTFGGAASTLPAGVYIVRLDQNQVTGRVVVLGGN